VFREDLTMPKLLTPAQVATLLQVPRRSVVKMARQDRLPSVRLSPRLIRFDEAALQRAIADRTTQPPPAA
jgi:excisionase family DNA binding protein